MAGCRPVSPERRCGGFRSHDIGLFAIYRRDLFGVLQLAEFPASMRIISARVFFHFASRYATVSAIAILTLGTASLSINSDAAGTVTAIAIN
jgi:hypothetical protein